MRKRLANLRICFKLLGGFGLILLLTGAMNVYGLVQMGVLADLTTQMYNHPLPVTRAVLLAQLEIARMDRDLQEIAQLQSATGLAYILPSIDEHEARVYEHLAIIERQILGAEGQVLIAETIQAFKEWKLIRDEVVTLIEAGNTELAEFLVRSKGANHVAVLESKTQALQHYAAGKATEMYQNTQATRSRVLRTSVLVLAGVLVSSGLIGILLSRGIAKSIREVAHAARGLAGGDLSQDVRVGSGDEVGELASAMNAVVATWREIVGHLRTNAARLSTTAAELANSSEQVSCTTVAQFDEVSRTSTAVEEMAASICEVARNAELAARAAAVSSERARSGGEQAANTARILERADEIMQRLRARSDEIGAIVNLIQEIAAQTNILALNAAIEAAGAGAAGARFDVVAEEIRKLAGRTSQATGEIAALVGAVQADTQAAAKTISEGAAMAKESRTSLAASWALRRRSTIWC